jgi:hypothetical protein
MISKAVSSKFEYYSGLLISIGLLIVCAAFTRFAVFKFDYVLLVISGPFFILSVLYCLRYFNKYIFLEIGIDEKLHFGSLRLKGVAEPHQIQSIKKVFINTFKIIIEGEVYYLYSRKENIDELLKLKEVKR